MYAEEEHVSSLDNRTDIEGEVISRLPWGRVRSSLCQNSGSRFQAARPGWP